ncbi:hypothetical protein ACFPRL_17000 [Pseudoclavibacter helvolus]
MAARTSARNASYLSSGTSSSMRRTSATAAAAMSRDGVVVIFVRLSGLVADAGDLAPNGGAVRILHLLI